MRPRAKVLLLMENEQELGRWRFVIETRGPYCVLPASCLECAKDLLRREPGCRAAMTTIPGALGADALVEFAKGVTGVLLFGVKQAPGTLAHCVVLRGDAEVQRVLETLRMMSWRKREPKPREPRVEAEPTIQTLLEERDVGRSAAA